MAASVETHELIAKLKEEGNAKFKAQEFSPAVVKYSECIEHDPLNHIHFSNRSAARVKLGESGESGNEFLKEALEDAQRCVELAPSWVKGYNRLATAFVALGRVDEARKAATDGQALASEAGGQDASLEKLVKETIPNRIDQNFAEELKGTWNGTVDKALGGYDQEMEFLDHSSVRIDVLGRSITGSYRVDCRHNPRHMTIKVPMGDASAPMMDPPPVPYIAKIDEKGLHLCCPYLKMDRPTEFAGPGYCLMAKGSVANVDDSDLVGLSFSVKLKRCAIAMLEALPDRKLEDVSQTDTEETAGQKMMAQVQYESSRYSVHKRFGEEMWKQVADAARGDAVPLKDPDQQKEFDSFKASNELTNLVVKLKKVGLLDAETGDPGAPEMPLGPTPVVSAPPPMAEPSLRQKPEVDDATQGEDPQIKPTAATTDDDDDNMFCIGVSVVAIALAVVAVFAMKKK